MQKISLKQKLSGLGIFILLTLMAFSFAKIPNDTNQETKTIKSVKITLAKKADKNMPLEISGFVRGEERADIAPMMSGTILRLLKHEGEYVKKGDVLATIDANHSETQIAVAKANVDTLQKTLTASEKYYQQLVSQSKEATSSDATAEAIQSAKRSRDLQIQVAKNQLITAQGALNIAQTSKKNSTLVAPFSGVITALHGREGGFANFSMPLVSLCTQKIKDIETFISATRGRAVTVGSTALLQTEMGQPLSGVVTVISAGSDSQSLKTLVRIHLNDTDTLLSLGDFLHGHLMIPRLQDAVSVPRNALISRGGDKIIFTLNEDNTVKEQPVSISSEYDGMLDITTGIAENQKIVIEGQHSLVNGLVVKPYESN